MFDVTSAPTDGRHIAPQTSEDDFNDDPDDTSTKRVLKCPAGFVLGLGGP